MSFIENIKMFFSGAFDLKKRSAGALSLEYENELEEFYILCFSDILGIDLPTSYYALEFYPILAGDLDKWQRNSNDKKSVWDRRFEDFDI